MLRSSEWPPAPSNTLVSTSNHYDFFFLRAATVGGRATLAGEPGFLKLRAEKAEQGLVVAGSQTGKSPLTPFLTSSSPRVLTAS